MNEEEKQERVANLISQLRNQCLHHGVGGIKELSVMFRRMDTDYSKRLCFQELKEGLIGYGLDITQGDLILLFDALDRDKNKNIDFLELVSKLRPPMSRSRINVINQAFDKLDVNKDGEIKLDDLKSKSLST